MSKELSTLLDTFSAEVVEESPKQKAKYKRDGRAFSGSTYIPYQFIPYIFKSLPLNHYAFIYHDKDVKDDGTPVEPHTQFVIVFYDSRTLSAVRKLFKRMAASCNPDNPQNTMIEVCNSTYMYYRYLSHLDNPEKAFYAPRNIICDNQSYWQSLGLRYGLGDHSTNVALAMYEDAKSGVSQKELMVRYGRNYMCNCRNLQWIVNKSILEEDVNSTVDSILARSALTTIEKSDFYRVLDYLNAQFESDGFELKFILNEVLKK